MGRKSKVGREKMKKPEETDVFFSLRSRFVVRNDHHLPRQAPVKHEKQHFFNEVFRSLLYLFIYYVVVSQSTATVARMVFPSTCHTNFSSTR